MTYQQFVCNCLGLYDGDWVDEIEANFEVEGIDEEDTMLELVEYACKHKRLGDAIASHLYGQVIERAIDEYEHVKDDGDFDYFCNGSRDTHFYYKGYEVKSWSELEAILNKEA